MLLKKNFLHLFQIKSPVEFHQTNISRALVRRLEELNNGWLKQVNNNFDP